MRPTLRSERQVWREAFCALMISVGPACNDALEECAKLADEAVEHWRKRYGREEEPEREPIETRRQNPPRQTFRPHPFNPIAPGSNICDTCNKLYHQDHPHPAEPIGTQRRRKPTGEPFYPRAHQFAAGLGTLCKECGEPENYPAHVPYPDPCRLCAQPKDHPYHDLNGPTYSHVYSPGPDPSQERAEVLAKSVMSRYSHKFEPGPDLSPHQCRICAGPEEAIIHQGNFVIPGSQHA